MWESSTAIKKRYTVATIQVTDLLVQELSGIFLNVSLVQVGGEAH